MIIQFILIKIKYAIGYITLKGGHRIGITGNIVFNDGQVNNISHIYSLNFIIERQVIGCSKSALKYILNIKENSILLLIELLYFSRFNLKMVLLDVQEIFLYYLSG